MGRAFAYVLTMFLVLSSCTREDTSMPDEMNRRAYLLRYVDVDSSLYYANKAYNLCDDYPDGMAEAISHKAFVLYQQMHFSEAIKALEKVDSLTNNQIELLCADVLRMKVSQRTGEFRTFYRSWHNAERRLERIDEELHLLSSHLKDRVLYARTEMHIIACTFYFYSQQDSASRAEMNFIEPYMRLPLDTAQWTNYMYMLGAGGILKGDSINVILKEFDYLTHVLTISRRRKDKYFQANSLQALATLMEKPGIQELIRNNRGGGMDFIVGQYYDANPSFCEDSLPLKLANHSLNLFRQYNDYFQTANVLRTKAELLFRQQRYEEALVSLYEALDIVSLQHKIEKRRVPYWEAAIYERLSLTHSALGNTEQANQNRKMYLSLFELIRQDLEEDARAEELQSYNYRLYLNLFVLFLLVLFVLVVFRILNGRLKKFTQRQDYEAEETLQLTIDETRAREMQLAREKLYNIERRAKVSLAENVLPYINRMLNTHDMEYIAELSAEILRINDILTEWIQVKQGRVAMNITTFPLQPLLDTIAKNRSTYQQKGIGFEVATAEGIYVKADRALTLFMINTLCDNARKFTPAGGVVSITVETDDNVVEISVKDTGCGLSQENVDKINNSKVFRISSTQKVDEPSLTEGKGFGFGLMNCKGIIGQMKKLSNRFHCCDFGVDSEEGKGSRFWFKLPRVCMMLISFFLCTSVFAQTDYEYAIAQYDTLCNYNATAQYDKAMYHGCRLLKSIPEDSIYLRMLVENEMAVASQSLCMWDEYKNHNLQCIRLYRQYTADPNLPAYAKRLHTVKSEITWSLFFTLLLFMCSVSCLIFAMRRSKRRRDEVQQHQDMQLQQTETLNRVQFELDRIHIQNRILDNSLSTIKHETMYYPSRIQQMAMNQSTDKKDLSQLMNYYNEVYTILLAQAQRQTAFKLSMDESVLYELKRRIMASISQAPISVETKEVNNILEIRIKVLGKQIPDNLFTPEVGNLDAFVAREIIRMHDASCGFPGLRLYVENNEIIITLWKNSRLLSSKTFSWN